VPYVRTLLIAFACLTSGALWAAQPAESDVLELGDNYPAIFPNVIRPIPEVRAPWTDISKGRDIKTWKIELTVDVQGRVVATQFESGPLTLRRQAIDAARTVRFKPFERDGKAVPARLTFPMQSRTEDYAGPADRTFPAHLTPASTVIALSRSACLGTCAGYRVELRGTGEVTYRGEDHVLITGVHRWRVDPKTLAPLMALLRRADYFKLDGYYEVHVFDLPTYITRLTVGERHKFVLDYGGRGLDEEDPHMPPIVTDIEQAIDEIARTGSWVNGDENTMAHLIAEKWNFRSRNAGEGLRVLLRDCNGALAREFIRAGAPVSLPVDQDWASIALAALCGDPELVDLMVSRGAVNGATDAKSFLEASVERGYPDMVERALRHDSNVNTRNEYGDPLIVRAAQAEQEKDSVGRSRFDSARVIELLLAAGAEVDAGDRDGKTALERASEEKAALTLLAADAKLPTDPARLSALVEKATRQNWMTLLSRIR
jgi:hypothetical protein